MEQAFLARHAESESSTRGLTNGDPRTAVPLTAEGREQARRLGDLLADTELDLCVTSEFERTQETADLALAGRDVPRIVLPGLNDIRFGQFEGGPLREYRAWARAHGPSAEAPGGGESRVETVRRYVLDACDSRAPAAAVEQVPYAEPFAVDSTQLERAVDRLDAWTLAPTWHRRN
ncbi:MAG: histidine phosphatase family protein [Actinobacteria bacterium]|nr:MAG: histidine phosphatase family protein [Actinomycetota bacterium]